MNDARDYEYEINCLRDSLQEQVRIKTNAELTLREYSKYITRGGFIKDCNGRLCKEGDKVKVEIRDNFQGCWVEAILKYSDETFSFYFEFIDKEVQKYLPDNVDVTDDYEFEIIEPCEPDICKDFKE